MRFPAAFVPLNPSTPVVPVIQAEPVKARPLAETETPRFLAWLDQLDPDQRVRAVGEW